MRLRESVVADLLARGDVWTPAQGLVGLRGETLARLQDIEREVARACRTLSLDEWQVPPALPLAVLQRADYFASFPQWLSLATHLTDDTAALERIASSNGNASQLAAASTVPARTALPPAVCYHVYAALADRRIVETQLVTAQGCCWRHEGERLAPLERGWAFTMREVVCVGSEAECVAFRNRGIAIARALCVRFGLEASFVDAEDPFFAPTGRGRALLQRIKGLKQELRLDVGDGDTVAAASFNLHERFFGDAFDIRLADGSPAYTACVAFGLERWLLAALVATHIAGPAEAIR